VSMVGGRRKALSNASRSGLADDRRDVEIFRGDIRYRLHIIILEGTVLLLLVLLGTLGLFDGCSTGRSR
jgi:hypothetical protein